MQVTAVTEQLIDAGRWISERGWVPATGGNFSARTESGFLVTASGFDKGALTPQTFIHFNADGERIGGEGKPSAETSLHQMIYRLVPDAGCVLHTHSVAATVLSRFERGDSYAISGYEMQKSLSGETTHLDTLAIPVFDNDQDIDALSARVAARHALEPLRHGVLIRGHGLYVFGRDVAEACRHIEGLEFLFACELERIKLENCR